MQRLTFACGARIMRSNERFGNVLPAHMETHTRRLYTIINLFWLFLFSFVLTAARRKTGGPPSYAKKPLTGKCVPVLLLIHTQKCSERGGFEKLTGLQRKIAAAPFKFVQRP